MISIVVTALLLALFVYLGIGVAVGRRTRGVADLLPLTGNRQARVESPVEFSTSTVAPTISLATVIMAFFELSQYVGLWLMWPVVTTAAGLLLVRLFASKIWHRMSVYDHRPTLHEFLGKEFDSNVLLRVGAIFTSLGFLGAFAVELMVGAKFFAGLIHTVPAWIVVLVLCIASFLYTAVGGFRALIITDRVQMICIWLLLLCLPAFYLYYIASHGGWAASIQRMPAGILDLSYSKEIFAFVIGIFVMNVPTYISDMSVWQRIAASQRDNTVTTGLGRSAFAAAITWGTLALLACFVFMIVTPEQGVNPLVSLVKTIGSSGGLLAPVVLFITVIGLYGAMLATSSTLLIAVSHTLYADVFRRSAKGPVQNELEARTELNISRTILLVAAIISTLLVQLLTSVGFSIADLVFAIYGAQLGLCPIAVAALIWDRSRLKKLSAWAAAAVSAGFLTGWAAAVFGRLTGDTDLVFLAPVFSLVASLTMLGLGISRDKICSISALKTNCILLKSVFKARRSDLYRFKLLEKPTRLDCLKEKCSKCCNVIGTPVVTAEEALRIGLESLMTDKDAIFIKSDGCACTLLKEGLCSIYSRRPKGCREYPWYNIDGRLYYDSGCPGIKYDIDQRPEPNAIQSFDNFFPNTPKFIISLIKRICIEK